MQRFVARSARCTAAVGTTHREWSESREPSARLHWSDFWKEHPEQPDSRPGHPVPFMNDKMRKSRQEWRAYHGGGLRHHSTGELRNLPDWEYADGVPAPHSQKKYSTEFHRHHLLKQFIVAGATVERLAAQGRLPTVPSSKAQRDWDPEIPLFLEDDHDAGAAAHIHRATGEDRLPDNAGVTSDIDPSLQRHDLRGVDYDPAEFVHDELKLPTVRPFWNRRLWALTNEFLVPKMPRNKNTIALKV